MADLIDLALTYWDLTLFLAKTILALVAWGLVAYAIAVWEAMK